MLTDAILFLLLSYLTILWTLSALFCRSDQVQVLKRSGLISGEMEEFYLDKWRDVNDIIWASRLDITVTAELKSRMICKVKDVRWSWVDLKGGHFKEYERVYERLREKNRDRKKKKMHNVR